MLKPKNQWRAGMAYDWLIQEMDAKRQLPGLTNTWTMPVENRLDMELTGIKTPVGMKIQGPSIEGIQQVGAQITNILSGQTGVQSVFAEHVSQGFYVTLPWTGPSQPDMGLDVGDVHRAIQSGIGGDNIAENVEGCARYPVNVRYNRDFRDDIPELERVVIATPSGAQIPIRARRWHVPPVPSRRRSGFLQGGLRSQRA